ncbi:MAG: metallophosphoesterase family protein, partial [Nitrososphaerales archaeon]
MAFTRILFATDVHGSDPVWKKFVRGAQHYKADVLIVGGDITGKNVASVSENPDGTYSAGFQDQKHEMKNKEELAHFERIVATTGTYLYVAPPSELDQLAHDKRRADRIFSELIINRLEAWVKYADENATTPIYVNAGNDDELGVDDVLAKSKKIIQPEDKIIQIDSKHEMVSAGFANITPWHCPRDITEEEIERRLEQKISKLGDPSRSIFNFHCPPVDSGLDTCPRLDTSVYPPKPVMDGGGPVLFGAGSTSVRKAIKKYQPMLGLHGHIHESRNVAKIGHTVCINPGSEYGEGVLRGALVNIEDFGYRSY